MNRVNVFAIHRCINEGYGLIQIFTEKIRIFPTKLWRVCVSAYATRTFAHETGIFLAEISQAGLQCYCRSECEHADVRPSHFFPRRVPTESLSSLVG